MDSPFVSESAQYNRKKITKIFKEYGFVDYPFEFWHYSSGDVYDPILNNTTPVRYGAIEWDMATNTVKPLGEQLPPLNSEQDFALYIFSPPRKSETAYTVSLPSGHGCQKLKENGDSL